MQKHPKLRIPKEHVVWGIACFTVSRACWREQGEGWGGGWRGGWALNMNFLLPPYVCQGWRTHPVAAFGSPAFLFTPPNPSEVHAVLSDTCHPSLRQSFSRASCQVSLSTFSPSFLEISASWLLDFPHPPQPWGSFPSISSSICSCGCELFITISPPKS